MSGQHLSYHPRLGLWPRPPCGWDGASCSWAQSRSGWEGVCTHVLAVPGLYESTVCHGVHHAQHVDCLIGKHVDELCYLLQLQKQKRGSSVRARASPGNDEMAIPALAGRFTV